MISDKDDSLPSQGWGDELGLAHQVLVVHRDLIEVAKRGRSACSDHARPGQLILTDRDEVSERDRAGYTRWSVRADDSKVGRHVILRCGGGRLLVVVPEPEKLDSHLDQFVAHSIALSDRFR